MGLPARPSATNYNIHYPGSGTGLYGSLKSGDILGAASSSPAASAPAPPPPGATYVDLPLSGMRETIARRLTQAKQSIPHYQLTATVNIEKTIAMRRALNERLAKQNVKVSVRVAGLVL